MTRISRMVLAAVLVLSVTGGTGYAGSQATFSNPNDAVEALAGALEQSDTARLLSILGPGSEALVNSGDRHADAAARRRFLAAYAEGHELVAEGAAEMVLQVGVDNWPLPIPLVRSKAGWRFDSHIGVQELIDRRIGNNELAAISVALTYVAAQRAFFALNKEYAERLLSTPDHHDGLYWSARAGESESPLAPLIGQAVQEGYPAHVVAGRPVAYQGYYFRILQHQGAAAPGGAKSYMVAGRMTDGFALVAWPANFGASGIMTFVVNQDGIVFQKDLGQRTADIASVMTRFNPDLSWTRVVVTPD